MSSAGMIAGRSPRALLGVKGAGLGRRGGVPGAWPFMAAGVDGVYGVYSQNQYLAGRGASCRGAATLFAACNWGCGFCKTTVSRAARAFGREFARQQSCSSFLVCYMTLALSGLLKIWQPRAAQNAADASLMET